MDWIFLLPDEMLISVISFLDIKTSEVINMRPIHTIFRDLVDSTNNLEYENTSFYLLTMEYKTYINALKIMREECNKTFDDKYLNLLIEQGYD